MTNFTTTVSRVLIDLRIDYGNKGKCLGCADEKGKTDHERVFRLDDILLLMPEIGRALDWGIYEEDAGLARFEGIIEMRSHNLLDAFLSGGYEAAETYLLGILKK